MASKESQVARQMLQNWAQSFGGKSMTVEQLRQGLEALAQLRPLDPAIRVEKTAIDGIPAEWVTPPNAAAGRVLYYLHGGAYCAGSCNSHRHLVAQLARACAARALVIEYRLAPEHRFPAALEDAVAAYKWLLSYGVAPENIVIAGDSAGGGLAVATLIALRDEGVALPQAAVLLSPWTDLEGTGDSVKTRAAYDPWLNPDGIVATAGLYIGNLDPRHPLVSPIYADLHGLPPVLVHVGHDEILLDDSTRLVDRLRSAGVEADLKIWEGMWHVFHAFAPEVPEAASAIEEIGAYVKQKLEK